MKILPLALAFVCLGSAAGLAQDEERVKRIVERIEAEIRASHTRTLEEIRAIIRSEIQKASGRPESRPGTPSEARPPRVYLGVTAEDLTDADRKALAGASGVRVAEVRGPAKEAGLKPGDLLIELDGEAASEDRIGPVLARHKPGDALAATVLRAGQRVPLKIVLAERKD